MVFGDGLQHDAPPEIAIDLDVPFVPTGIAGIAPPLFFQHLKDRPEQMMPVFALFVPVNPSTRAPRSLRSPGQGFMRTNDAARGALKMQPGEVARPTAHQRLDGGQHHDEQARMHRVVSRLDARPYHIREGHAQRSSEHQIRHDAQTRQKNSQSEKKHRQGKPFDAAEISGDVRLRCRVHRLKEAVAEDPVINNGPVQEPAEARGPVNLAAPFGCAGRAKKNQVLETQKRFRFAVTFLLFQESAQGKAAIVPDQRRGAEPDDTAGLLQTPAEIHIVPGLVIFRVKAADAFKRPAIKSHVTAGNMFCDGIGEEHVTGTTRGRGHAGLDPILRGRRDVRAAHAGEVAGDERADQIVEPVAVGHAIGVGIGEDLALGGSGARVARMTQPMILLVNIADVRKAGGNLAGVIGGAIIHQHDLVMRIVDLA